MGQGVDNVKKPMGEEEDYNLPTASQWSGQGFALSKTTFPSMVYSMS
jgi:hypothetical protein